MRLATERDGAALADLVNFAGGGAPYHLWRELSGPEEDPWAVGAERQSRRAEAGEVIVLEESGAVVAALMGAAVGADPPAPSEDEPPMLGPIRVLERAAPNTLYVNALATFPRARGRGLGQRLLAHAEKCAAAEGLRGVSIICSDGNTGALRLYERLGYTKIGSAPIVKNGWESNSTNWILLFKETAA
jgi:ribosomal protein S18 acetylase RimI-like enzyme